MLRKPTIGASDPQWVVELKTLLGQIVDAIRLAPARADNKTAKVERGTISALPQFFIAIITGAADANGLYECSVYTGGPTNAAPLTGQKLNMRNCYIDAGAQQGAWLVRPMTMDVGGTNTLVWDCVPNIPMVPDTSESYVLASIAGTVMWVWAAGCGVTTTTAAPSTTTTTTAEPTTTTTTTEP